MLLKIISRLLRVFFRLLYHQLAWAYDFVAYVVSLGQWRDWVMTTLPYLDGPRVLELGSGPGNLQAALSGRGVSAVGVDASPQMVRLARRRLIRADQSYQLVNAQAQQLPFPDQAFDQVTATFPTEFILSEQTLTDIRRVLTPGGVLVVLPNAWITGVNPLQKLAARIFDITNQAPPWDDRILEHFSRAGFQVRAENITHEAWTLIIILARKP